MSPEQILADIESGRHLVPERLWGGLKRYFVDHVRPGGFLVAVLENDLRAAVGKADEEHFQRLRDLSLFLYNFAPARSYGSHDDVEAWLAAGAAAS